ncbi:MAG TPA: hypothetical protein VMS12_01355 [Thermoanaerobaculia bacterium]|nr:hypothetical protein [Thermoanaerobaculia bacterium]
MAEEFINRLDDLVRQELSFLGYDYGEVVSSLEEMRAGEGAVIRVHPPWEDITIEEPEPDVSDQTLAARLRRTLKTTLEAPNRPAAPPEMV